MPYFAGYHRSRIEVLQYDRQQCIELIESFFGFYGHRPAELTDADIKRWSLNQHAADWTLPKQYESEYPEAEDEAMYFKVHNEPVKWVILSMSGAFIIPYNGNLSDGDIAKGIRIKNSAAMGLV